VLIVDGQRLAVGNDGKAESADTLIADRSATSIWEKNQDKTRIAVPGTVALGMERNPDKTRID